MSELTVSNPLVKRAIGRVFRVIVLDEKHFSKTRLKNIAMKGMVIPDDVPLSARRVEQKMNLFRRMRPRRNITNSENFVTSFSGTVRTYRREIESPEQDPIQRSVYDIFIQYKRQPHNVNQMTISEQNYLDKEDTSGNMSKVVKLLRHFKTSSVIDFEKFDQGKYPERDIRTLRKTFIVIRTPQAYRRDGSSGGKATEISSIRSIGSRRYGRTVFVAEGTVFCII